MFGIKCLGHFALTQDEGFGVYDLHTSQKSTRHFPATAIIYEKIDLYILMKCFKKKTDREFTFQQNINFRPEVSEKLPATVETSVQHPGAEKVTQRTKKSNKTVLVEEDDKEFSDKVNEENVDSLHNYGGSIVWTFPRIFQTPYKIFSLLSVRRKLTLGLDFPTDGFLALGSHSLAHDGLCDALTDNHNHNLARYFQKSQKCQPKSYLQLFFKQLTLY